MTAKITLSTSTSLAQSEEGVLLRKLRENPSLAQFHGPPRLPCEIGEGDGGRRSWGALNPEKPPVLLVAHRHPLAGGAEERRGSVECFGRGHLVSKYVP